MRDELTLLAGAGIGLATYGLFSGLFTYNGWPALLIGASLLITSLITHLTIEGKKH